MKRDFISILDWTSEEIRNNLDYAVELKQQTKQGSCPQLLSGKTYGMFFHKPSLRTRLSFEVGIVQLGGTAVNLSEQDFKIGERESGICRRQQQRDKFMVEHGSKNTHGSTNSHCS